MVLTPRAIAVAALDLAEEEGAENLTMRSLASRLHRRPSSLYNHITGREDLIEHMRAIIVEHIEVDGFATQPWDIALVEWAKSYLSAFAMWPSSIRLLATTPITDPATLAMYDVVVSALMTGGWPEEQAIAVMRTVEAHVLGSALDVIAPENLLSPDAVPPDLTSLRRSLDPAHFSSWSAQAAFDLGIHALLDGLRARLPEPTTASQPKEN